MCTLGLANPRKKKRIPPAFWCGYPQLFGLVVMEKRRPVIGRASDAALVRRCRNRLRSSAHWSPRGGGQWLTAAGWLAAGCFRGPDVLCGRCCYRDTLRNTRACPLNNGTTTGQEGAPQFCGIGLQWAPIVVFIQLTFTYGLMAMYVFLHTGGARYQGFMLDSFSNPCDQNSNHECRHF